MKIGLAGIWEWLRLTMYLNHSANTKWEYRFPNVDRAPTRDRSCSKRQTS